MSRRPARCTQAEISRAAKVAAAQGMAVRVKPNGEIWLVPAEAVAREPTEVEPERRIVF